MKQMANNGIRPNVLTLNAILEVISTFTVVRDTRDATSKTLAEFKSLNIRPSLASYYFILNIFCRNSMYIVQHITILQLIFWGIFSV